MLSIEKGSEKKKSKLKPLEIILLKKDRSKHHSQFVYFKLLIHNLVDDALTFLCFLCFPRI